MSSPQSKSGVIYAGYFPPELMEQIKADPERYSATYAKLVGDFQKIVENSGDPNKSSNYSRHIGRNRPDVIPDPPPLQKEDMMEELASLRDKFANRLLLGDDVLEEYRHTTNSIEQEYSTVPISQLKPILLSEMSVEKRQLGKYFLCRVIAKPVPILATMIGVEDTDGSVSVVLVHNFPFLSQSTLAGVDIVFPLGKHLLIREPSYTYTDTRKSAYIRVYSPTDLIFLEDDDPILRDVQWKSVFDRKPSLPSTVDGWRLEGHSQFNERQWLPAAICFTNALKLDSTSQIMLLNRAETYLKLGWYFSALHDVQQARRVGAIIDESLKRKAVMREIRAKYGMCLYEDVVHIAKEHPDDSECKEWLSKAIKRIAEKTRGKYDWGRIFREGRRNTKRFDVAEFQGPVEIRERDGQAGVLGVFVTRDIKIGELLVVGRPLDAALPTESKHGVERSSSGVIKFGDRRLGLHMTMVRLINRVWDDAHANAKMQCFYTGSFCNLDREPYPPVYGERRPLEHPLRPSVDIDGTRIECLAFTNMFCISADSDEKAHINAMYDFPSFLNHACVPSVESVTIGDIMVIRAMRNMTAGEEATIAYIGRDASFISRSSRLYKSWWFSCDCTLCEADRTDGLEACQKRDELMLRVDTISKVPLHLTPSIIAAQIANELKVIVLELRGTYKTTGIGRDALINRPELLEAMRILVEAVLASRNKPDFREYATANMFLLELTGIIIPDKSMDSRCGVIPIDTERSYCNEEELQMNVSSCLKIARYHDSVKNYTRARAWVDAAKWLYAVTCTKDHQAFVARFHKYIETLEMSTYF